MSNFLRKIAGRASAAALALRDDRSGVAAVEFVFIAPLLITLWLGTMEISQGIEINKKVGRSASMIGDIIGQTKEWKVADVNDVLRIGAAVLQPYQRDAPTITITYIDINATQVAKVVWSRRGSEASFTPGLAVNTVLTDVPVNLRIANTTLIKVTSDLDYFPVTSWSIRKNATDGNGHQYAVVPMSETYYMRPRQDTSTCSDC